MNLYRNNDGFIYISILYPMMALYLHLFSCPVYTRTCRILPVLPLGAGRIQFADLECEEHDLHNEPRIRTSASLGVSVVVSPFRFRFVWDAPVFFLGGGKLTIPPIMEVKNGSFHY